MIGGRREGRLRLIEKYPRNDGLVQPHACASPLQQRTTTAGMHDALDLVPVVRPCSPGSSNDDLVVAFNLYNMHGPRFITERNFLHARVISSPAVAEEIMAFPPMADNRYSISN